MVKSSIDGFIKNLEDRGPTYCIVMDCLSLIYTFINYAFKKSDIF